MDGPIWIALDRYLLEVESMPETRTNITIKECLIYLIQTAPDKE